METFAEIFNNPDSSVMAEISRQSPTAIIMRILTWMAVSVLKSAWIIILASVLHSAGIVCVIGHYFWSMLKNLYEVWVYG